MELTVPNQQQIPLREDHLTTKEVIQYTLLAGLGVGVAIYLGNKYISNKHADAADTNSFQEGRPETIAKQIQMAFENDSQPGTDTKLLRYLMTNIKSKEEMAEVEKQYETQFHKKLYRTMQDELQSTEYEEMMQIIQGKPQKTGQKVSGDVLYVAWAKRLRAAFDKMYSFIPGTDEEALRAVINEIPTQRSFVNVGVAYYKQFKASLMDALKSELQGNEYYTYMKMITDKPKA